MSDIETQKIIPREFWSSDKAALWWKNEDERYKSRGINFESENFISAIVKSLGPSSVLEIGAGTGRMIGKIQSEFSIDANSADINSELCKEVARRYPMVKTHHISDKLPFPDGRFDLIYVYQVLQHMPSKEMRSLLAEMLRVSNSRVLLMEGFVANKQDGELTHPANGGSFYHNYEEVLKGKDYTSGSLHDGKIKFYLIKK